MERELLYVVGGAARSGKTIVARHLLGEGVPYFSLDYLVSGSNRDAHSGVSHDADRWLRAEQLWPVTRPLLRNIAEVEPHYLVEGDALLPGHLSELLREYPGDVRGCFLGYSASSVADKVADIRRFPSPVNDWVADLSDQALHDVVVAELAFSKRLQVECARLELLYIESSFEFGSAIDAAVRHLGNARPNKMG